MKKNLTIVLLSIIFFSIKNEVYSQTPFGVNLAGAEFGSNFPGTYNVDYTYPTSAELDYYQAKGLNLIRLPIKWERIQPVLNGNLSNSELLRIKNFLLLAQNRNMKVIIDLHNYCRYNINGIDRIIGSNDLSIANIKDLWTKLALELNTYTNIWGYGIMNEPNDLLVNATWFDIAQEIINGIRINDLTTRIIVGGDSWSSAERWMQYSDNLKNLSDTSNKLTFEAHVYFDNDASGQYDANYENEGAYPNIGVDRVEPFVNWLLLNNLNGFIGEYGIPANDNRWLVVLDNFLSYLKANCINGTYWAGGPWWGNYILSIEPVLGVDKPQMSTLLNYLNTNSNCSSLNTYDVTIPLNQYNFSPNPFLDVINISGIDEGEFISIYDINGRFINTQKIINSRIENLGNLKSGIYLLKYKDLIISKMIK
ncbi:MAG: cellulase family glycosylhydrolase [Bacteroidetes bacterium]|nr:cellulase family glycosylhydrolase [Bacteroidota bacterium]